MLLVNPWTLSALVAMVVAFYASARSLQLGPAIAVITFTSLTGNIVALVGGILVFHDPIGHTPAQIAARIAAFCLVILGAALLPGRLRAGAPPSPTPAPGRSPTRRCTCPRRLGPVPSRDLSRSSAAANATVSARTSTAGRRRSVGHPWATPIQPAGAGRLRRSRLVLACRRGVRIARTGRLDRARAVSASGSPGSAGR